MTTIRALLMLFFLGLPHSLFATGYDHGYRAYSGDLDGDGDLDLAIKKQPSFIPITLDEITIPIPLPNAMPDIVLRQRADHTFERVINLSTAEQQAVKDWPASSTDVWPAELNGDGFIDAFVNMGEEFAAAADVFLYATGIDEAPPVVKNLDAALLQFFDEFESWQINPDFFSDTAGVGEYTMVEKFFMDQSAGYYCATDILDYVEKDSETEQVIEADHFGSLEQHVQNCFAYEYQCEQEGRQLFLLRDVNVNYREWSQAVDWSMFSPRMEAFIEIFTQLVIDKVLTSGDSSAVEVVDILEEVLGTEILGGVINHPGQRTVDEADIDGGTLDTHRFYQLIAILMHTKRAINTRQPTPNTDDEFRVVMAYPPTTDILGKQIRFGVNFKVPAGSTGTIVQKVRIKSDIKNNLNNIPVRVLTMVHSECNDETFEIRGNDDLFFYEAWRVTDGLVQRDRVSFNPLGYLYDALPIELPLDYGFADDHYKTPIFASGPKGTFEVEGEVKFFPDANSALFTQMRACRNPRTGGLISSYDNVEIPIWETGFQFLPPPAGPLPHTLSVRYLGSGLPIYKVVADDYEPKQ